MYKYNEMLLKWPHITIDFMIPTQLKRRFD